MQVGTNIRYKHPLKTEIYSRGLTVKEFADNAQLNRHTMMNIFQQKHKATATTIINASTMFSTHVRIKLLLAFFFSLTVDSLEVPTTSVVSSTFVSVSLTGTLSLFSTISKLLIDIYINFYLLNFN